MTTKHIKLRSERKIPESRLEEDCKKHRDNKSRYIYYPVFVPHHLHQVHTVIVERNFVVSLLLVSRQEANNAKIGELESEIY